MQEQYFLGTPPRDIEPSRCLLIGDLGRDQPFALDYRRSLAGPTVLYLHQAGWIEIAPNVDTLIFRLGLGGEKRDTQTERAEIRPTSSSETVSRSAEYVPRQSDGPRP